MREKDRDLQDAKRMIQIFSASYVGCNDLCLQEVQGVTRTDWENSLEM